MDDPAALQRVQDDLVAWGVLEGEGPPALTSRARAALARAAIALREQEVAGQAPTGHPVVLAAQLALRDLAPPHAVMAGHARYVAAVELASLPDAVRRLLSGP